MPKSTKTGGKEVPPKGLQDGKVSGVNAPEMVAEEYRNGTSDNPAQPQATSKPFGSSSA